MSLTSQDILQSFDDYDSILTTCMCLFVCSQIRVKHQFATDPQLVAPTDCCQL